MAESDQVLLVLGERGGALPTQDGRIRWARASLGALPDTLRLVSKTFDSAPDLRLPRDITGMYVDASGLLWVSSAEDGGNFGPFRSAVQLVGRMSFAGNDPVTLLSEPITVYYTRSRKVEGVGAGVLDGAHLSVVTEDEGLGGTWFPLHWGIGLPFAN